MKTVREKKKRKLVRLTDSQAESVKRVLHILLQEMVKHWSDDDFFVHKWNNIANLFMYMTYHTNRNGRKWRIYDVTDRYKENDPKRYGWDKEIVVVKWRLKKSWVFVEEVLPTSGYLFRCIQENKGVEL